LWIVLFTFPNLVEANQTHVLQSFDEVTVSNILNNEISDLSIKSLKLITEGWDHLVAEVNGEWIFRFPKEDKYVNKLKIEKEMLNHLKNFVTTPIPYYSYFGLNTVFGGYRKIPGVALTRQMYLDLSQEARYNIAKSFALFFTELHRAINVEKARQLGYEEYHIPILEIENELLGTLPDEIDQLIRESLFYMKNQLHSNRNMVFLHVDLHGGNLAFNISTKQISGIFDFSDAAIGDYSVDFGALYYIHSELAILASEIYANLNNVPNPAKAAAADYILRKGSYLLGARKNNNRERELLQVSLLKEFIPIWNEYYREAGYKF
jgi:aminoglycoside 2''-phosphotransferase